MKEEIVSLETARLSKSKLFDWKVINHYKGDELIYNGELYNFNDPEEQALWNIELTSAPSQSLLQKWLREVHNIHILVDYGELSNRYGVEVCWMRSSSPIFISDMKFLTYELALEEGIKNALSIIKL